MNHLWFIPRCFWGARRDPVLRSWRWGTQRIFSRKMGGFHMISLWEMGFQRNGFEGDQWRFLKPMKNMDFALKMGNTMGYLPNGHNHWIRGHPVYPRNWKLRNWKLRILWCILMKCICIAKISGPALNFHKYTNIGPGKPTKSVDFTWFHQTNCTTRRIWWPPLNCSLWMERNPRSAVSLAGTCMVCCGKAIRICEWIWIGNVLICSNARVDFWEVEQNLGS